MGDIIDLPSRESQGMAYLEEEIRKMMLNSGSSEEAIEIALETLKDVYKRYGDLGSKNFTVTLPQGLSSDQISDIEKQIITGVSQLNEEHSHMINRLAAELVLTKIKLHELEERN